MVLGLRGLRYLVLNEGYGTWSVCVCVCVCVCVYAYFRAVLQALEK